MEKSLHATKEKSLHADRIRKEGRGGVKMQIILQYLKKIITNSENIEIYYKLCYSSVFQ